MDISAEWKSTIAAKLSSQRYLVIISYGVHFLEEYGMFIQMQSVVFAISATSGDMLPLVIHNRRKQQDG
jgi:hypothetical protein